MVALQLLWLRDAVRDPARVDRPAEELVAPVLVRLAAHRSTGVTPRGPQVTVAEFYHTVARLGGYLVTAATSHPAGKRCGTGGCDST